MDWDETQRVLAAVLGRLEEQSGILKGITYEIAEVRGAVTKLQSDVTQLKSEVTALRHDVTKLQGDVTQLQGEVAEFKAEMHEFRQETTRRFDVVDSKLEWLTAKVFEHDEALFHMRRKQA